MIVGDFDRSIRLFEILALAGIVVVVMQLLDIQPEQAVLGQVDQELVHVDASVGYQVIVGRLLARTDLVDIVDMIVHVQMSVNAGNGQVGC